MAFIAKNFRRGQINGLLSLLIAFLALTQESYGQLKFIPNEGQWHEAVQYRAQLTHGRFYLEESGFTYAFLNGEEVQKQHHEKSLSGTVHGHAIKVRFLNANDDPELSRSYQYQEYYNFYMGQDASEWASKVNAFDTITYQGLYPNTDLEVTSDGNRLKYNFRLQPGANPETIQLEYNGAERLEIEEGHLKVQTSVNTFRELAPKAYQVIDGEKAPVPCKYELIDRTLQFHFPEGYQDDQPLIIDPEVIFSTYSGSPSDNFGYTATFDTFGRGYSAGTVFGANFPTTSGAFQTSWAGGANVSFGSSGSNRDIGILKYNDSGTKVKYVTYLGGNHNEDPHSMIVNNEQDLLVFGNTGSNDFPMAGQPYQDTLNGNYDIFVAKIAEDGTQLKASTYFGGSGMDGLNGRQTDSGNQSSLGYNYGDMFRGEVIVDDQDRVLVATATKSTDFPVTNNAYQQQFGGGGQDGCVVRFGNALSKLDHASYWGGQKDDAAYSLTIAPNDDILFTGGTLSNQFNFTITGHQSQNNGGPVDGFVTRINPRFDTMKSSTLWGTPSYDQSYFVQTNTKGHVFLTGQTQSKSFTHKNAKYHDSQSLQFISKFSPGLDSLMLSTTFGSGARDFPDLSPSAFLVQSS